MGQGGVTYVKSVVKDLEKLCEECGKGFWEKGYCEECDEGFRGKKDCLVPPIIPQGGVGGMWLLF